MKVYALFIDGPEDNVIFEVHATEESAEDAALAFARSAALVSAASLMANFYDEEDWSFRIVERDLIDPT